LSDQAPDKKSQYVKKVRENHLDFLYNLFCDGIDIGQENRDHLVSNGYITEATRVNGKEIDLSDIHKVNKHTLAIDTEKSTKTNHAIDIIEQEAPSEALLEFISDNELVARREKYKHKFEGRKNPILRHEWLPESTTDHEDDFIDWINSINKLGFNNKKYYRKFSLYVQQSYAWLQDRTNYTDFDDEDIREDWKQQELKRCAENSLYWLNKYVWYKEGDAEAGKVKYVAAPAHEFLAYMEDCGYSMGIAKGRQMAATTTLMSLDVHDVIFKRNHFMKFITEDIDKAQEIIEDKLKFAFAELPDWMRPDVLNERDNMFKMGYKHEKGTKKGVGSKIQVAAPKRTAIAGGAPQKVKIDEAGNIKILGIMIGNARPTMMYYDKATGNLVLRRRLIFWGCVCAGTKVWNNKGELVNIEDLKQSEGILGYDGEGVSKEPITWMKPPAKKPCYRITTTGGDTIECSEDHPLMWGKNYWRTCPNNTKKITFKRADEVRIGDHLMMIREVPVFGKTRVEYARLLGLFIGDGNYSLNSTPQMYVAEKEIGEYIDNNYNKNSLSTRTYKNKVLSNGNNFRSIGIKGFVHVLRKHKMHGQSKDEKRLPFDVDSFDKKSLSELIGGYFDADGNVDYKKKTNIIRVVLTSTTEELLKQVKFQLIKFGIASSIVKEYRNKNGVKLSKGQKCYIFRLYVNNQSDVLKFQKEIKFLCNHKQKAIDQILNIKSTAKNYGQIEFGKFIMPESGKGKHFLGNDKMTNLKYKKVTKVEFIGEKDVYNLTAGKTHTYIANGFVTANTGGEMDKGGKAFETELMTIMRQWDEGKYSSGIVPIFFNWECRPGATQADYDREKEVAYAKGQNDQDPDAKKHITEFHQTWPRTIADVFRTSAKTLVDEEYIEASVKRINAAKKEHGFTIHQSGYFEPIYDLGSPAPEGSDVPFKIIGAEFVPTDDLDRRASVTIFSQPKHSWNNRYYQGTDPIDTYTGLSNMASSVWDKYWKTPAAIINWRVPDYPQVFLQVTLLSLYYDNKQAKTGIKELLESNRGTSYYEYRKAKGLDKELVLNYQLPPTLQNKTTINDGVGIDNKGLRNTMIINRMFEMFKFYGDNFYHSILFEQLKTFTCAISDNGKEIWGPVNKKYFMDDTLFSTTFSYICSEVCFAGEEPTDSEKSKSKVKLEYKLVRGADNKLKRMMVRTRVPNG